MSPRRFLRRKVVAVTAAVVAATNLGTGDPSAARALSTAPQSYTQQAKLIDPGGGRGFGFSVALDGDTAVIGSAGIDGDGTAAVFTRTGELWTFQTELERVGEEFGHAVAVSGDTALVGAPGFFDQANSAVGVHPCRGDVDAGGGDPHARRSLRQPGDLGGALG